MAENYPPSCKSCIIDYTVKYIQTYYKKIIDLRNKHHTAQKLGEVLRNQALIKYKYN